MKYCYILFLFIAFLSSCYSQESETFIHPTEKYEVEIPKGWTHSTQEKISLLSLSPETTIPRTNFNVNIIKTGNPDFDGSYDFFLKAIAAAKDFKIIKQGEKIINNRKYKWLIENHKNSVNGIEMTNYVFFTNKDGNIFILTMVSGLEKFDASKSLFDKIASSLKY